jgi:NADPH2:quinone reductase
VIVKMRHGAYCDEAVATPSQLVKLPSTFDYAEGRDVSWPATAPPITR